MSGKVVVPADEIRRFLDGSEFPVLFAGAGVSARAGLPTWGSYMAELAGAAAEFDPYTKYQIDRAVAGGQFERAAAYYFLCADIPETKRWSELVRPLAKHDAKALHSLVGLPFVSMATTNFDRALLDAYAAVHERAPKEANIDDPTLTAAPFDSDFYVARIHGRIEVPQSLRLTEEQLAGLAENSGYVQFLTHLFTRRQVLFVGFSFADPAIRAALRSVRAAFDSRHLGVHAALVPEDAPGDFIKELERHSIARIRYKAEGHHAQLWDAFESVAKARSKAPTRNGGDATQKPFAVAQKYLATSYARMRLGRQLAPLSRAVVEGLVSAIVSRSADTGISEVDIAGEVSRELSIGVEPAGEIVSQSLAALLRDGILRTDGGDPPRFGPAGNVDNTFDRAIARLVEGAANRHEVRESERLDGLDRQALDLFFRGMVLRRGWDLGAAYAARRMPEALNVLAAR